MASLTRIWDAPTRLFHWTLATAVTFSLYSGLSDDPMLMERHMQSGYVVLTLLVFRLLWGVGGASYARFSAFRWSPRSVIAFARDFRSAPPQAGHDPLGSWGVLLMLLLLTAQVTTGLFANDDLFSEGPLVHRVDDDVSDALTTWHHRIYPALMTLIGLHLASLLVHRVWRKENLLTPMISGNKHIAAAPTRYSAWAALIAVITAALTAWALVTQV